LAKGLAASGSSALIAFKTAPKQAQDAPTTSPLVRRLVALTWQYRWPCLLILMLQVGMLALGLLGLSAAGQAIDVVRRHSPAAASSLAHTEPTALGWLAERLPAGTPFQLVLCLAGVVTLAAAARAVLGMLYADASGRLVQGRVVPDLRAAVFAKLQRLSLRFFADHTTGSIINRITTDVQSVRVFLDGVILQGAGLVISLSFFLTYMFSIHVGLTMACLATTPALWYVAARFSRAVWPAFARNRELLDQLLLVYTENVRGVQVVKGFNRESDQLAAFAGVNRTLAAQQRDAFWKISLFTPTVELLQCFNVAVLLGYGGYLAIAGKLEIGSGLIVFAGLLQQFSAQITRMTGIVNSVQQSLAGAKRVFEVLDTPTEIRSPSLPLRPAVVRGELELCDVTFRHSSKPALDGVCLRIAAGERIAVLGPTGAGKTTLLRLLSRFHDPQEGAVLFDGVDLRAWDLTELRRKVGIVPQETTLFHDTVAANIAFGDPSATQFQIDRAARLAAAHRFISELPQGYDTIVAEGGKNLSGGQRQRLAIARALLFDPPVLLMDDPTAAVDCGTEREIMDGIERALAARTTIVVTNRLRTLQAADRVIVLSQGQIVQAGHHRELAEIPGFYREALRLHEETLGVPQAPQPVLLVA
jgi:ATP-binding cassette subfamily B protein